ncbi:MAG TPA: DUF3800 domain-containing protein [Terriglobia bacterium]|nr:DUF3800 domain-containing protein [Terriglobia bacterium]
MLIFLDESGDCGMKDRQGSSKYFVVTTVLFEENDAASACDIHIGEMRAALRLHEDYEFHFNRCSDFIREQFLKGVIDQDFFYSAVVLNKAKLWGEGFKDKNSFYKYTTRLVFENIKEHLQRATVVIDRCGERRFRDSIGSYLRRKINDGNPELIKKVKMEPSHSNNLLQLVDMVSGAIFRSFRHDKKNRRFFRKIISSRELRVQVWPR